MFCNFPVDLRLTLWNENVFVKVTIVKTKQ